MLTGQRDVVAMLDVSGGSRAGTVVVARQAEGPAGSVQRCPGVPAVEGGAKEREEGRDGGVWAEGLESVRDGAGPAKRRRDGQWRQTAVRSWARRQRAVQESIAALHVRCARWCCLGIFIFPINKRISVIWKQETRATSHAAPVAFPIMPGYRKWKMPSLFSS